MGDDPCRVQQFHWDPGRPCSCKISSIYVEADGSTQAKGRPSAMIKQAAADSEAVRKQPALIAGDFNAELDELPVAFALGCSDWSDPGSG